MIRVWIETAAAVTRAGIESLLESDQGIEVVHSSREADVILREELPVAPEALGAVPIVVLTDGPASPRAFQSGVRAILPHEAAPEQIVAALYAASAGLIAMVAGSSSLVMRAETPEVEVETLTPREVEALEMLAEGLSNKQIAARLNISEHTAKFHVNSILSKLHAGTRTEAVIRGIRCGLVKV
ncbi:MAG TPA: response regulator transcription factor [Bryobacteraceae bacterium]|nr:response regulator transcription factor [Bryobacteraceae bacterium]